MSIAWLSCSESGTNEESRDIEKKMVHKCTIWERIRNKEAIKCIDFVNQTLAKLTTSYEFNNDVVVKQ